MRVLFSKLRCSPCCLSACGHAQQAREVHARGVRIQSWLTAEHGRTCPSDLVLATLVTALRLVFIFWASLRPGQGRKRSALQRSGRHRLLAPRCEGFRVSLNPPAPRLGAQRHRRELVLGDAGMRHELKHTRLHVPNVLRGNGAALLPEAIHRASDSSATYTCIRISTYLYK